MGKAGPSHRTSRKTPAPDPARIRRGRPERFVAMFVVFLVLGVGLLMSPFMRPAVARFSRGLVQASGLLISAAGGKALVNGTVLRAPANEFAIEMKDGCNGVNVMLLLWSAVLAFPASWAWKLKGLLIGSGAIQSVNFLRFISLFYLGQYNMAWFEFAHFYLWESLIMLDALVVFLLWVSMVFRAEARPHAGG